MPDQQSTQVTSCNLAIWGASGRMGLRLMALSQAHETCRLVAGIEPANSPRIGQPISQLTGKTPCPGPLSSTLSVPADAIIDFSHASALPESIAAAKANQAALVIGTTGLKPGDFDLIDQAAQDIPVMWASNYSTVVNVLWHLSEQAARLLPGYDIEIVEAHHNQKMDAPSGTAMTLAERLCAGSGRDPQTDLVFTRHGHTAKRKPQDLTVQTLRIGDDPGQHTAYLAGPGERLELKHVATSRDSYAHGAIRAALWLQGKPAGRYQMNDVLGL